MQEVATEEADVFVGITQGCSVATVSIKHSTLIFPPEVIVKAVQAALLVLANHLAKDLGKQHN